MFGNSSRLAIYGGIFGALLITAYGLMQMAATHRSVATHSTEVAPVAPPPLLIADRDIPRGAVITASDLTAMDVPAKAPPGAVTSMAQAVGSIAAIDIPAYSFILSDRISHDPAAAGLATTVPDGYRAVELPSNAAIAVGNLLRPGDHVDVEVVLRKSVLPQQSKAQAQERGDPSEARTLLQDVPVLAVGHQLGDLPPKPARNAGPPQPPHGVTLAVTPDQLAQLSLARQLGEVQLALRNPHDAQMVTASTAHLDDIRGITPPPAAPLSKGRRPIELITGNRSRIIYSTNEGTGP